jgi:Protein of unknown function (DUF1579)
MTNAPHPALRRLDPLIGTWRLAGRTLDSAEDNMTGIVTIEWLPGGFFMVQRGEIHFPAQGMNVQSLEVLAYDPESDTFPSMVYSNLDGAPASYQWDVRGTTVTHWTRGSKYIGTLSEDGKVLTGGWRPADEQEAQGFAYDATMTRVS